LSAFIDRHSEKIAGVLSCFDRVVITGTLPGIGYAQGMTSYCYTEGIRIFDYPRFVSELRDNIRENAQRLAEEHGIEIEFVRKAKGMRKEKRVREILAKRGDHPGLVHILSAMESCPSYRPCHDKKSHKTYLKPDSGKCLHYYFYFIDSYYGLCHLRVPTWCPFRLQFYFNGHNYLANQLKKKGMAYNLLQNAFVSITDYEHAQRLADGLDVRRLHRALDLFAERYCPIRRYFGRYHWSLMQVEYATDIIFKRQPDLAPVYETITRTAIHVVKADDVATFLGRKLTGNYQDELGNHFSTRIEGTRVRHHMGTASIKMYDKFGLVLRIETTANNISFFKHHREVAHRDGSSSLKLAPMKKTIYSLHVLRRFLAAANRRYLDFISGIDDPTAGMKILDKVSKPAVHNGRNYKGFNFFSAEDQKLFEAVIRGEHNISGIRDKDLKKHLQHISSGQLSRILKRLRTHGLIKRVGRTYKYYLTNLGRRVFLTGLKVKTLIVLPELATT
jgi:hypothetical protein